MRVRLHVHLRPLSRMRLLRPVGAPSHAAVKRVEWEAFGTRPLEETVKALLFSF